MRGLLDLTNSERGTVCCLLLLAATVLTGLGRMTFAEWQTYTEAIAVIYVGSRSLTSMVASWKGNTDVK